MILSPIERRFFLDHGYVVARGAVGPESRAAAIDTICRWLSVSLGDRESWYRIRPEQVGIVPLHQPQSFWNVRQEPLVHAAFAELLGTERLWVSMDRASFLPPLDARHPQHQGEHGLHWDVDPGQQLGRAVQVQGALYLTDTPAEQGAFQCVPEIFQDLPRWLDEHPSRAYQRIDAGGCAVVRVGGRAGDLVIWNSLLPHASSANLGSRPRLTQYVAMFPEGEREDRGHRVACWRERRAPQSWRGWANQPDPEPWPAAELSALGRKLLGLDPW